MLGMKRKDVGYPMWVGSRVWLIGPVSVGVLVLFGAWMSLGVHVSVVPFCIELHILWFVVGFYNRERGEEIRRDEGEWIEEEG